MSDERLQAEWAEYDLARAEADVSRLTAENERLRAVVQEHATWLRGMAERARQLGDHAIVGAMSNRYHYVLSQLDISGEASVSDDDYWQREAERAIAAQMKAEQAWADADDENERLRAVVEALNAYRAAIRKRAITNGGFTDAAADSEIMVEVHQTSQALDDALAALNGEAP